MADFKLTDLYLLEIEKPTTTLLQEQEIYDKEVERLRNISDATIGDKIDAWFLNAANQSVASDLGEWVGEKMYASYDVDPNFTIDDDIAMEVVNQYDLGIENFGQIRNAKSHDELMYKVSHIIRENNVKKSINNTLGEVGIATSSIAGNLIDDIAIGAISGGVGSIVSRSAKLSKYSRSVAVATDISLEVGLATARYLNKDDYTISDAFLDMTIGLVPSLAFNYTTMRSLNSVKNAQKVNDSVHNKLNSVKSEIKPSDIVSKLKSNDNFVIKSTTNKKMKELKKTIRLLERSSKPTTIKKHEKAIAEMLKDPEVKLQLMNEHLKRTAKNDPEIKGIINKAKDIKSNMTKTDMKKLKKAVKKTLNENKTKAIIATTLVPTLLMADDDGDFVDISTIIIAGILGAGVHGTIKNLGGYNKVFNDIKTSFVRKTNEIEKVTEAEIQNRNVFQKVGDFLDTSFTSARHVFKDNPQLNKRIDEFMGLNDSINLNMRTIYESAVSDMHISLKNNFEQYKRYNDKITIEDFLKKATDYIDNPTITTKDKYIQKFVDDYNRNMEYIYAMAKEYKVKGFKDFEYKKDMTPRLWKFDQINKLLTKLDSDNLEKIRLALHFAFLKSAEEAIKKGNLVKYTAKEYADKYTKVFMTTWTKKQIDFNNVREVDAVVDIIKKQFKDIPQEELDDLINAIVPYEQTTSRAKHRITFNPHFFEDTVINVEGKNITIGKDFFVERNLLRILDKTSHELAIDIAYAKKGYTTRKQFYDSLYKESTSLSDNRKIDVFVKVLEDRPIDSASETVDLFIAGLRAFTAYVKLPLVAFSTAPEFFNVLTNSGFFKGLNALKEGIVKSKKELLDLRRITGLASFNDRLYYKDYIGYDEIDIYLNASSPIMRGIKTAENYGYTLNRLGWLTDVVQFGGMEVSLNILRKYAKTGKGLSEARLKEFGITEDFMKEFKEDLLNKKELDIESWSNQKQNRFANVIRAMNQLHSPETMMHSRGLWTQTTTVGRLISPLLNYSATIFNEQGLPLLKTTDRYAVVQNMNAIIGGYIGLSLRYSLEDKEVSDEDLLIYSVMNAPLLSGVGVIKGVLDPATLQTTADFYNILAPQALEVK